MTYSEGVNDTLGVAHACTVSVSFEVKHNNIAMRLIINVINSYEYGMDQSIPYDTWFAIIISTVINQSHNR